MLQMKGHQFRKWLLSLLRSTLRLTLADFDFCVLRGLTGSPSAVYSVEYCMSLALLLDYLWIFGLLICRQSQFFLPMTDYDSFRYLNSGFKKRRGSRLLKAALKQLCSISTPFSCCFPQFPRFFCCPDPQILSFSISSFEFVVFGAALVVIWQEVRLHWRAERSLLCSGT